MWLFILKAKNGSLASVDGLTCPGDTQAHTCCQGTCRLCVCVCVWTVMQGSDAHKIACVDLELDILQL